MGFPFYVTCCFSLAALNILSLCLVFVSLISKCLGVFLLGFILYGTLCTCWTLLTISLISMCIGVFLSGLLHSVKQKLCRPKGNGRLYLKYWKGKIYNQDYCTWQGSHSKLWRNKKLFRQAKVKRIQYHQTSFTTNVKGNYRVKEYKRRKWRKKF